MKKIIAILTTLVALSGCSIIFAPDESPARQFVGTYAMTVHETGTWGKDKVDNTYNLIIEIRKAGFDRIYMDGAFETYGTVEGNTIRLDPIVSEDEYGRLTTNFISCTLHIDELTMQVKQSGKILSSRVDGFLPLSTTLTMKGMR